MSEAAKNLEPEATNEVEAKPIEKAVPISQARFGLADEKANRWRIDVPMGISPEQIIKDESYWQHIAQFLKPGDEIICMPDNMAWKMVLHVAGAGRLFAHTSMVSFTELVQASQLVSLPSIYKVEFQGTHHKWAVIRENKPLKDGFETEALARRYAQNHEAAVQR
jgi:hypothetical protein